MNTFDSHAWNVETGRDPITMQYILLWPTSLRNCAKNSSYADQSDRSGASCEWKQRVVCFVASENTTRATLILWNYLPYTRHRRSENVRLSARVRGIVIDAKSWYLLTAIWETSHSPWNTAVNSLQGISDHCRLYLLKETIKTYTIHARSLSFLFGIYGACNYQ